MTAVGDVRDRVVPVRQSSLVLVPKSRADEVTDVLTITAELFVWSDTQGRPVRRESYL